MEETLDDILEKDVSLNNLFKINKSLIIKKNELREKLMEKINYSKFYQNLLQQEISFFDKASNSMNDREFDEILKKYEKLSYIILSIDDFKK